MSSRMVRGFAALGTFALIAVLASSAVAQQAPVRVIQASDGTLYVVQGGKSWTLVPDQASDSEVAALNPNGEIDGTFPNELLVVQAPAAPPAAAPAPAPAPPAAAPAAAPITGTADLTGKAANDIPGTAITVGATITSVVDPSTKSKDVYSIVLTAGANYQLVFTWPNNTQAYLVNATVRNPDQTVQHVAQAPGNPPQQCSWQGTNTPCTFTIATTDTYYLEIGARSPGVRYTVTVKQS